MQKRYKRLVKAILDVYFIFGCIVLVVLWLSWPLIVAELTGQPLWGCFFGITFPVTAGIFWWWLGESFDNHKNK